MDRVELFERLVAFDTTSVLSNLPLARFIADLFDDRGARVDEIPSDDGEKLNLAIFLGPEVRGRQGLILSGHLDCVPALEEGWESDPFVLTDCGGRWVGRGASDMKGFLALAIDSALRLDLNRLRAPLVLLLTYDEEVGTLGAKRFRERWPVDRPLPRATVIGEPTSMRVVRMHKGHLKIRIRVQGRSAHSGYPHLGVNAIEIGARVIAALAALRAELQQEQGTNHEFFPEVPFVPLNVGVVRGGTAINIVPDRCDIELGMRPLPGGDVKDLIARVESAVHSAAAGSAQLSVMSNSPPMILDAKAEVYRELCDIAGQKIEEAGSVNFATDAGWLQELGLDCVLFGPGSIEVAHRANEFMPKDQFERASPMLDELIERFCGKST